MKISGVVLKRSSALTMIITMTPTTLPIYRAITGISTNSNNARVCLRPKIMTNSVRMMPVATVVAQSPLVGYHDGIQLCACRPWSYRRSCLAALCWHQVAKKRKSYINYQLVGQESPQSRWMRPSIATVKIIIIMQETEVMTRMQVEVVLTASLSLTVNPPKQRVRQTPSSRKQKKHLNRLFRRSLPILPFLQTSTQNNTRSPTFNAVSSASYNTKPLRVSTMLETPAFSVDRDLASHSLPHISGQYFTKSPIITTTTFADTSVASPTSPRPMSLLLQQQQQALTSPPTSNISHFTPDACSEPPAIPPRSASRGRKYYSKYIEYDLNIKPGNTLTTGLNATPSSYYEPNYSYRDSMSAQSRNSNFSGCYQRSGSGRSRYSRKKSLSFESRRSLESLLNANGTAATTTPGNSSNTNSAFTYQNANATMTSTNISNYTTNKPTLYSHDTKTDINPLPVSSSENSTNLFNSRSSTGFHGKKNSIRVLHKRNSSLLRNFINEDLSFLDDSTPVDLIPPFAPLGKNMLAEDANSGYSPSIYSSHSTPSLSRSVSYANSEKEAPKEELTQKQPQQQQQQEKKVKEKTSRLNLLTRFIYRKKAVGSDVC